MVITHEMLILWKVNPKLSSLKQKHDEEIQVLPSELAINPFRKL